MEKYGLKGILDGIISYSFTKAFLLMERIPKRKIQYLKTCYTTNLNIGAGLDWEKDNWIAIDKYYDGDSGIRLDLLKGNGLLDHFKDNSVDSVYSTHALEHFTYNEAYKVLRSINLILRHNGVCRIVVPDMHLIARQFCFGPKIWWKTNNMSGKKFDYKNELDVHHNFLDALGINTFSPYERNKMEISRGSHFYAYSFVILKELLIKCGFHSNYIYQCRFNQTKYEIFKNMDDRPMCSLHVEAVKK